jgi:ABC-2 type transport system ATP-binding protein
MIVAPQTIHALLGPNGAGKTTVLRMVAGLMAPTAGSVLVVGRRPTNRLVRGEIGWVPATDRSFYLRLSARQNLTFFARLYGLPSRSAAKRVDTWIERVGLEQSADRPVRQYSHGMIKRLIVARALMFDPEVLVVDEATHDLDPRGRDQIKRLVREAADNGAAVVWATQRLVELRGFADDVTVLEGGETRFSGSVVDLASQSGSHVYLVRLESEVDLGSVELSWGRLERVAGGGWRLEIHEGGSLSDAFAELTEIGIRIAHCTEETPDLERAFLRLTQGSFEV